MFGQMIDCWIRNHKQTKSIGIMIRNRLLWSRHSLLQPRTPTAQPITVDPQIISLVRRPNPHFRINSPLNSIETEYTTAKATTTPSTKHGKRRKLGSKPVFIIVFPCITCSTTLKVFRVLRLPRTDYPNVCVIELF